MSCRCIKHAICLMNICIIILNSLLKVMKKVSLPQIETAIVFPILFLIP